MSAVDALAVDRVVCRCLGVSESEIRCAVMEGTACCLRSVIRVTGAGGGCNCCHRAIRDMLAREQAQLQAELDQCEPSGSSPTCVTR
jgi:bacterioferritin-associated ferredoxin